MLVIDELLDVWADRNTYGLSKKAITAIRGKSVAELEAALCNNYGISLSTARSHINRRATELKNYQGLKYNDKAKLRLHAYCTINETNGCWEWHGATYLGGMPRFSYGGRSTYANRISFSIYKNKKIHGLRVIRTCGTKSCVNPDHMEAK